MKISCTGAGKRFNREWVFRRVNYEFTPGNCYAITGPNGSGKSTLLQILAGAVMPSEGKISYTLPHAAGDPSTPGQAIEAEQAFKQLSITAPYLNVIEEMTLIEFLRFHQTFKPFIPGIDVNGIIAEIGLQQAAGKQIRYYSSGMKQRVKLAQAIFSDTPCLLLDEPCSNLDQAGIQLYHQLIRNYCKQRLVIVSSNDEQEYAFCDTVLNMKEINSR